MYWKLSSILPKNSWIKGEIIREIFSNSHSMIKKIQHIKFCRMHLQYY